MSLHSKQLRAIVLFVFWTIASSCTQLRVDQLKVEYMENPSTVDALHPRFSWVNLPLDEQARGLRQSAYRIGVASSLEKVKAGNYDVWDSGKQPSEESHLVPYAGPALQSGADYYWRVRTWDQQGHASEWSKPAHWGMGLLSADAWKAQWIASKQDDGGAPLFRQSFDLPQAVRRAKVFICGLGFYELYLNGQRIGDYYLVPNVSNYTRRDTLERTPHLAMTDRFSGYRVLYLSYDVTPFLQSGKNALGVVLGNGFYQPDKSIASVFGHPCVLLQLEITFTDGTRQTLVSDGSWLTKPSAIRYNGIYQGEIYDANEETPDWALASCDEQGWTAVDVVEGPQGELTAQTSPSDKIMEVLQPCSLTALESGDYEVDFGKEIAGWVRLKNIQGEKGDTLRVTYISESPQGNQQYIYKGTGLENYAPRFTWFAFSKAIISGVNQLSAENIQAEAVNTEVHSAADFYTSNELFNQIHSIWRRSQLDNMHGCIASDCPHRERLPYTGDGQAACATVMCNFDAAAFYQKWIRDMRDAQDRETGYVPNSAPWQPGCGGGVAWGAAMNLMPWEFYVQYGDKELLAACYEPMKAQVRWMQRWQRPDGTMHQQRANAGSEEPFYWFNLGEWCPPYGLVPDDLVHTFYLWQCADFTARAAHVLGQQADEMAYHTLAEEVKKAFHARYYDPEQKSYGDFGGNVYALAMGVPDEQQQAVVESLRKEIVETHGGHIHTGFLGTKYFFEVLSAYGLHEVAYEVMNKRDFPSYGHWIEQGATTTWEQWDGGNSHNHPMFGSGLTWFYRCLAGVRPVESAPGFRLIQIRPYLTEALPSVHYAYETPYGPVVSDIRRQDNEWILQITVPVGSQAELYLPTDAPILESDKPLEQARGCQLTHQSAGQTRLTLEQGQYRFRF
ncbi:MAG: family 78 glycoside hydrolase catalytic domain [Parabacteroides sp.]